MAKQDEPRRLWASVRRALRGHCPRCGGADLFKSYLKQVEACPACGEAWSEVRADDGPAWLTILIVGHLLAPVVLPIALVDRMPLWLLIVAVSLASAALCLLLLPRCKGVFIAMIWALRANSS
ncbi:MAG: DUF983 domain-containing protein [Kiloniellales bacterium]|nr:DUF983 domain-containing protein [Kiloniellales bacterium]MDJ0981902.1 DUF983 domain-containing protein [Kiloniellales bacterium]